MEEIKRYRCIKECAFEACDDNGFTIDNEYCYVEPGSIWQESNYLIAGGPDSVHLDREDGKGHKVTEVQADRLEFADSKPQGPFA